MLRDALKMGASAVGGCPDLDPDPGGYVEAVLAVAAEHGSRRSAHRRDDPARLTRLASAAGGLRPGVTLGPAPAWRGCRTRWRCVPPTSSPPPGSPWSACRRAAAACWTPSPASPSRVAPARVLRGGRGRGRGRQRGAARPANPVGRGDPLEAAYLLASHGEAPPRGAYDAVSARPEPRWGCPRSASRRAFPPNCSRCAGRGSPAALARLQPHRGAPRPGGGPYECGARVLRPGGARPTSTCRVSPRGEVRGAVTRVGVRSGYAHSYRWWTRTDRAAAGAAAHRARG